MVSEYPEEQQNPPEKPGMRPDEQPPPRQRVPDDKQDVSEMTTDERMDPDPKRTERLVPVKGDERTPR